MQKRMTFMALLISLVPLVTMAQGIIYQPKEELTKDFLINIRNNFSTMEKIETTTETQGTILNVQELGFGKVLRLKATKDIGGNVFVVDKYNYRKDEGNVPTLIVVAGKPSLEDSFGKTQNGAVTLDTRNGIAALKDEFQILFLGYGGAFAKEIAAMRNDIFNYMDKNNFSYFGNEEAKAMAEQMSEKQDFPKITELVSGFVANATPRAFDYDKASFVVTQIWNQDNRPYGNPNNLGIMYVVPPEKSDTIVDKTIWLNLIYDTGRNIIANSLNVLDSLKDQKLEKIAVQLHLPGAGKFLFEGVSQTEANAVFVQGLVDGIREIKKMENGDELASKLELHFAFTPHYFKDPQYFKAPLRRIMRGK